MRSFILMTVGLAVLVSGLLSQACHAQSEGGIARLTSVAYQPESPVTENRLFGLQTGHYGFHYNCDHEEDKRNHPAICWRQADADQLPKRMGCLARVRHEAAQVSRRILDGMCDTGCSNCQQQRKPTCACAKCVAQHDAIESTVVAELPVDKSVEQASVAIETMAAETVPTTNLASATGRRSGLIRLTRVDSVTETIQNDKEIVASDQQFDSESIGSAKPPVARITSAVASEAETAKTVTAPEPTDLHRLSLLERLKIIQSAQASGTTKAKLKR